MKSTTFLNSEIKHVGKVKSLGDIVDEELK